MSMINMQDNIIKSNLVQQFQHRGEELQRNQDKAQLPHIQELARQADEVVLQITKTEQEAIREEQERRKDERKKKKKEPSEINVTNEESSQTDTQSLQHRSHRGNIDIKA